MEIAATSLIDRFATTRERVIVSRPFVHPEPLHVEPQGQRQRIIGRIIGIEPRKLSHIEHSSEAARGVSQPTCSPQLEERRRKGNPPPGRAIGG
jgi:hypothetical protein